MSRRSPLWLVWLMLGPTVALLLVFNYIPAFGGLAMAFMRSESGQVIGPFCGLANFAAMAGDRFLHASLTNQLILLAANLAKTLIIPLLVAELIVHLRSSRLQLFFRTSFILPMVVPGMVGILLWRFVYDGSIGLLNQALEAFGLSGLTRAWLGSSQTALAAYIGIGFPWCGGLALLIYLAGLMNLDQEIWQCASLDGAVGWRRVWYIDIPLLRPQIRLLATLTVIGTLQDFGSLLVLTGGGPGLSTHVPALHMYFQAFRFNQFGYAAAIGFVLFLVIFGLSAFNQTVGRRAEAGR